MGLITSAITYYRSTYYSIDVQVTPPTGMTANTILFTVKPVPDDVSGDTGATLSKTVTMSNNSGTITIGDTDIGLTNDTGTYFYSIHIILSDGNSYPFAAGQFLLKVDTTNRTS